MERGGTVYIITNFTQTTFYTGVTSDLLFRIKEHREKVNQSSFSSKYNTNKLVYYCFYPTIEEAISEEKRIKGGSRAKKIKAYSKFESRLERFVGRNKGMVDKRAHSDSVIAN